MFYTERCICTVLQYTFLLVCVRECVCILYLCVCVKMCMWAYVWVWIWVNLQSEDYPRKISISQSVNSTVGVLVFLPLAPHPITTQELWGPQGPFMWPTGCLSRCRGLGLQRPGLESEGSPAHTGPLLHTVLRTPRPDYCTGSLDSESSGGICSRNFQILVAIRSY